MAAIKTTPDLELLESKLKEVAEACSEMEHLRVRLRRLKRRSEAHRGVIPDIATAAAILTAKCQSLERIIDDITESLPDD